MSSQAIRELVESLDNRLAKYSVGDDIADTVIEDVVNDYFRLRFNIAGATEAVPELVNVFDGDAGDLITTGLVSLGALNTFNVFIIDEDSSVTIPNGIRVYISST